MQVIQQDLKTQKEEKKVLENEVTVVEANSNSVVSSLEQILLAIENIYSKCKEKKEWTQHEIDKKEFTNKKGYEKRVAQAKQMIKNINYYIADYQTIIDQYKIEKSNKTNI